MQHILLYGDSLSWEITPTTRECLAFDQRWPGILEIGLNRQGHDGIYLDADQHQVLGLAMIQVVSALLPVA
ncbi:MAG: hypothetical protein Q7R66_00970 [Undibacterium sp.]|uniref:hypothetical protein n=1 Tax=Undibacterium sp. TaxID=1914977 RepID=UPI0027187BF6|nr:hypothetical protein [Undibacterium sp.]MDO8650749.1 hypothetical protein [Undibacterium sp.]